MITSLYKPADEGLLERTREALLNDMRVADELLALVGTNGWAQDSRHRDDDGSSCERLQRKLRLLLPDNDAGDALFFRETYGWTALEVSQIVILLREACTWLRHVSPILDGTKQTLLRDAEKCHDLSIEWLKATE